MGKVEINVKNAWKIIIVNVALMLFGSLLIIFWPDLWNHILFKEFKLTPGTIINEYWSEPPPMVLDIYFFNWTNSHEFNDHSIKPKFVEVGPYRFQEYPKKVNVTFHDKNSTVSYRKQSKFIFLPDESKGKMTDLITSVNVVGLSAANQARHWNVLKVKGVELSLRFFGQQVHLTKTASELLFEGYEDPIISVAKDIAKIIGIEVPFEDPKFGWFYMRNESSLLTGDFNADTQTSNIGRLRKWNYQSKTDFFEGSCGNLEGASAGELFPPGLSKKQTLSVFSPEMCRNVEMDFEEETEILGITGKKYIGGDRTIDNGTKYPENSCFCSGDCLPSGVINVTSCRLGAPVFMSFPHFFNGDPYYLNQIEGMAPDKEKHQFYMTFEPTLSLPLEVTGRFQLNVMMKPIRNINLYRDVPVKIMPIVWFEQRFKLNNEQARVIKLILWIPKIVQIIGFIIALIGIYNVYSLTTQKRQNSDIQRDSNYNAIQVEDRNGNVPIEMKRLPEKQTLID